jgi:transposase InsO family protein
VKERTKFILEWERRWEATEGRVNVAELCRQFGVSRDSGHRWIARYREANHDLSAVLDRSHRPVATPTKVDEQIEELVVAVRKAYPRFGPKKLRSVLVERYADLPVPAASTIGEILKRRGLSQRPKRRRRRSTPFSAPFAEVIAPNTTWCADFKGQFRTTDGRWCYPLTILDAHTRFLIRCEALLEPTTAAVKAVFDSAFQEYGLPRAIRTDNGPPFASVAAGSLTPLAVWWLRLGIRPERIAPGKPQQNGRQERFHRTLKAETASPPRPHLRAQQRAFDEFRRRYNHERPHEALGQRPPSRFYERSTARYPRKLLATERVPWFQYLTVSSRGFVVWDGKTLYLSAALPHETVELRATLDDDVYDIFFFDLLLGRLTRSKDGWRITQPRRLKPPSKTSPKVTSRASMHHTREVQGISSD